MKTTFNRSFFLGLIACVVLLGAAVHGLHAFQVSRQSRFLLEQAQRAEKDQQYETAIKRFQQYVKLAPEDVAAQAEYGLLLADRGDLRDAAIMLEKVLRAEPDRDAARRRLVKVEMRIGRASDAKAHLDVLLAKSPHDAVLRDEMGICQATQGDFDPALASFKESVARDPHQVETYVQLAQLLRQLKRPDEADAWIKKLVAANPKSAPAHLFAGRYLAGTNRTKQAGEQADEALKLAPKDADVLLLAFQVAIAEESKKPAPRSNTTGSDTAGSDTTGSDTTGSDKPRSDKPGTGTARDEKPSAEKALAAAKARYAKAGYPKAGDFAQRRSTPPPRARPAIWPWPASNCSRRIPAKRSPAWKKGRNRRPRPIRICSGNWAG